MAVRLTLKTIEYLVVEIKDVLSNVNSLVGMNARYDVRIRDSTNWVLQNQAAVVDSNDHMRLLCLVDTTTWAAGNYELFAYFSDLPEQPRVGPLHFEVA